MNIKPAQLKYQSFRRTLDANETSDSVVHSDFIIIIDIATVATMKTTGLIAIFLRYWLPWQWPTQRENIVCKTTGIIFHTPIRSLLPSIRLTKSTYVKEVLWSCRPGQPGLHRHDFNHILSQLLPSIHQLNSPIKSQIVNFTKTNTFIGNYMYQHA